MMTTQDWTGKPLTVLGLSRSGSAVARFVAKHGGKVFLSETTPASPQNETLRKELEALGVEVEMGGHSKQCFTHADLVVVSPGIPPSNEVLEQLRLSGKEVISEVEFAYRQAGDIPFVGITGTNGKSTTTTLISWILTQAGFKAPACGNIGLPITDVINEQCPDYLVAELSSFQLEFSPTLKTKASVFTNFKPDHLDWHGSIEAYQEAKLKLFSGAQSPEWSVVLADDPVSQRIASKTEGKMLWFSRDQHLVAQYEHKAYLDDSQTFVLEVNGQAPFPLFAVDSLQLIGDHNYENVLASISIAYVLGVKPEVITKACQSFAGLEHRLEKVDAIGPRNVLFYNDSKATNTDAAISALRAFKSNKVILIAGGYDKMTPLDDFVTAVQANAKSVILIGAAKERFAQAFEAGGYHSVEFAEDLDAAIGKAYHLSHGEPVLFAPACSSFDMFKNFEERGRAFKASVQALKAKNEKPLRS
ncbi:MAG: UDP-N-acetylmuramoylalanine--D-glutamate ligase [Vampirovibrio sp.]|jgi:UDP-N-acetylmuramoylalanine--D-glutamate ligase|nr:UDP-N-acetylmuramoylalanine--D-glutamate ligase [Vampirovibrio sp.]